MKRTLNKTMVVLAVTALGTHAALITGVTVDSVSSQIGAPHELQAVNIINGNGLTGGGGISSDTHGNIPKDNMWLTNGRPILPKDLHPEITFNLGDLYNVNTVRIWNVNESGFTRHGANQINISAGATLASLTQLQTINVAQGGGTATEAAQDFASTLAGVQFVRFTIITNHDGDNFETQTFTGSNEEFAGLSEVRFEGTVVPEPATLGMLVIFGGGLLFVRRKLLL